MTTTPAALIQAKYAEAAETRQYPDPQTVCKTSIDKFTATNVSGAMATISVSLAKAGETAGVTNRIVQTKNLQPGACYTFPEIVGHILEPNDTVSTNASAASAIVIRMSGRQFT